MSTPYTTGTVSVTNGSPIVTGVGTAWQTSGLVPGLFSVVDAEGFAIPVLPTGITNTQLTLAFPWPGATASGQEYWISYDTENAELSIQTAQAIAEYMARLNRPMLAALSGVEPVADSLILLTGTNTATTIPRLDLVQGVKFDAEVPTLAGRAQYDAEPKDFRVLVADIGDGRTAFYDKLSNASGDWSVPFYISGTAGPAGVANPRGTYAAGTAYAKNDLVLDNGSSWIAKVATTGNAPPTLPTTSNTWWQLAAQAGSNGTGTGDVVGPAGGVTAKQVAGFGSTTGKAIVGLTSAEIRTAANVYSTAEAMPKSGGTFTGPLSWNYSGINWNLRTSTEVTIAAGASVTLDAGGGLLLFSENLSQGGTALFVVGQARTSRVSDPSDQFSNLFGTSGKICVSPSSNGLAPFLITNNTASAIGLRIFSIRTRDIAG